MTDAKHTPGPTHEAFARDLVKTCRSHGMDSLNATYRAGFKTSGEDEFSGLITVSWSEGRHGANGRIAIKFEGCQSFEETKETHAMIAARGQA